MILLRERGEESFELLAGEDELVISGEYTVYNIEKEIKDRGIM